MSRPAAGPLRIALVSEHASPLAALGGPDAGGQNVHVAALARALAERGHQVTVHTRRTDPDLPRTVPLCPGVVVDHVGAGPAEALPKDELLPHMADFADDLTDLWTRGPAPDVVHAHYWMSGLAALRAGRRTGVPVALTYHALGTVKRRHQGEADTSPPERIAAERAIGRAADAVVATCADEVRELAELGVAGDRVRVVPCGVDPEVFSPVGPVTPSRGPDAPPRLLQVNRLVPRKGGAVAVAALARLPGVELAIAGGPPPHLLDADPEAQRLRAIAQQAGVGHRLRLLGAVAPTRMPSLLRGADLVLCPADYEPFGIVPLEAMACAVPVVASAVGGQCDTVVDRVTGRHVPPRDPDALAAAVRDLLADPGLRASYGAAGRRRVLRRYDWRIVAAATEQVYAELTGRDPAAPAARGAVGARGVA